MILKVFYLRIQSVIFTFFKCCMCIGNHMISSAIWDKSALVNFLKATKLHEHVDVGRVQFVV